MKDYTCGIGVIGCGTYCGAYLKNLGPVFKNVRPVACADLNTEAAEKADLIILAIKPIYVRDVIDEIRPVLNGKAVLSIAAGWTVSTSSAKSP